MTRRRFLAAAGVAAGMAGARAAERPLAARKADLATRFEEASRLMRAQTDSGEVAAAVLHVRRAGQDCPAPSARREGSAVPDRVADQADDRVGCVVAPRSARAGADRRGDEVPAGLPRRRSRRRHHPPPAHAHVGIARHVAGKHRASPPARAPVGVRGSNLRHATALPTRREGQLPEHGHPAGGGIVEKVSGEPMPGFMARTMFDPLGMRQTSFGLGGRRVADTAQCQVPEVERATGTGTAPTGGISHHRGAAPTRPRAIGTFLEAFASTGDDVLPKATAREMRAIRQARCGQASVWAGSASRAPSDGPAPRRRSATSVRPAR